MLPFERCPASAMRLCGPNQAASDAEQDVDVLQQLPLPAHAPSPRKRRLVRASELSGGSKSTAVSQKATSAPAQAAAAAAAGMMAAGSNGKVWSMSSVLLPSALASPVGGDREAGAFLLSGRAAARQQQQQAETPEDSAPASAPAAEPLQGLSTAAAEPEYRPCSPPSITCMLASVQPDDLQAEPPGMAADLAGLDVARLPAQPAVPEQAAQAHAAAANAGSEPDTPAAQTCALPEANGSAHAATAPEEPAADAATRPSSCLQHAASPLMQHSRQQAGEGAAHGACAKATASHAAASEGQHSSGPACGLADIDAAMGAIDGLVNDMDVGCSGDEGADREGRCSSDNDDAEELNLYIGDESDTDRTETG